MGDRSNSFVLANLSQGFGETVFCQTKVSVAVSDAAILTYQKSNITEDRVVRGMLADHDQGAVTHSVDGT